jgi:hypothetical protein
VSGSPDVLPKDAASLRALLLAERARHAAELTRAQDQNERLRQIIRELQRARFGRSAERLDPGQLELALEDTEQALAAGEAAEEARDPALKTVRSAKRKANRGALPAHLPRIERIVDIEDKTCPCCAKPMHVIGEDRSERLDVTRLSCTCWSRAVPSMAAAVAKARWCRRRRRLA